MTTLELSGPIRSVAAVTALLDTTNDAQIIEAMVAAACADINEGMVLLWAAIRRRKNTLAQRTFAFALTQGNLGESTYWPVFLLDLLSAPYNEDPSFLINVLSALRIRLRSSSTLPESVVCELVGFVSHALQQGSVVRDSVLDFLAMVCERELQSSLFTGQQLLELRRQVLVALESPESGDFAGEIKYLEAALDPEHGATHLVLGEEDLREIKARIQRFIDDGLPSKASKAFEEAEHFVTNRLTISEALRASERFGAPIQEIQISLKGNHPPIGIVTRIVDFWSTLYESILENLTSAPVLVPVGARPGSFVLIMGVRGAVRGSEAFALLADLMRRAAAGEDLQKLLASSPIDPVQYRSFLEAIASSGVTVQVLMVDPLATQCNQTIAVALEQARAVLPSARSVALRYLDSEQIPQADELQRLFRLLELVLNNEEVSAEGLGVVPRQVNYYKHAARILRLMERDGSLTSAGEQIARLDATNRLMSAVVCFECSDCGEAWIRWSGGSTLVDVDPGSAEKFLRDVAPELGASTATRRARTLRAWHNTLAPVHYSRLRNQ